MSIVGLLLFLWIVGGSTLLFGFIGSRDRPSVASAGAVRREV